MRDNSKSIGDLAELKVITDLTERGFDVSIPFGDNCKYDLIVDINGSLKKVQVKARSTRNNVISVELRSCMRNYTYNKK